MAIAFCTNSSGGAKEDLKLSLSLVLYSLMMSTISRSWNFWPPRGLKTIPVSAVSLVAALEISMSGGVMIGVCTFGA